jgi:hypothetical protein
MNKKAEIKVRIQKMKQNFIRDKWGNLTPCYWNEMYKEEILKLEKQLNEL